MKTFQSLASQCFKEHSDIDDAWEVFRNEANARYSAEEDGDQADYAARYHEIFEAEKIKHSGRVKATI